MSHYKNRTTEREQGPNILQLPAFGVSFPMAFSFPEEQGDRHGAAGTCLFVWLRCPCRGGSPTLTPDTDEC